jgi:hypothetical protein
MSYERVKPSVTEKPGPCPIHKLLEVLDRLSNRLTKIATEARKLGTP